MARYKGRICWRCFWWDVAHLPVGLTAGWFRAWTEARRSGDGIGVAWLYWRCWYFPLYIHPHGWDIACKHDIKPQGGKDGG
jgi:hypothetical protein